MQNRVAKWIVIFGLAAPFAAASFSKLCSDFTLLIGLSDTVADFWALTGPLLAFVGGPLAAFAVWTFPGWQEDEENEDDAPATSDDE